MANDINVCTFTGRLGRDPETRYFPDGTAVANLSLAVGSSWKDKTTGEKQERTEWVRCVARARLAEVCGEYLKKGKQVAVVGRFTTRKWQDSDGNDRYTTEIVLERLTMFGERPAGDDDRADSPRGQADAKPTAEKPDAFDDFQDDIPF